MNPNEIQAIIQKLRGQQHRLALAESCTGGLVSARLTSIAGASEVVCGSMVTYREATKGEWLAISAAALEKFTAVSQEVTQQMSRAVLAATPEASLAAAVTGHLGPDAPEALDGIVFVSIICRDRSSKGDPYLLEQEHHLAASDREGRQAEAANVVLRLIDKVLDDTKSN